MGEQNSYFSLCLGRESLELPRVCGNTFAQQECTVLKLVLSVGEEGRISEMIEGKGKIFQLSLTT